VLGEPLKIWGFPFNIYAMAKCIYFKFGTVWMANLAHHKITQMIKVGLGHGMVRSLQNYASPLIFLQWLKLQWMFLINGII